MENIVIIFSIVYAMIVKKSHKNWTKFTMKALFWSLRDPFQWPIINFNFHQNTGRKSETTIVQKIVISPVGKTIGESWY